MYSKGERRRRDRNEEGRRGRICGRKQMKREREMGRHESTIRQK